MSFNEEKIFEYTSNNSNNNNAMNVTIGMFHEGGHAKFHMSTEVGGEHSPKYCVNKSFDLTKKYTKKGESGKFVDHFLYNSDDEADIIIISSLRSHELMNKTLFTGNLDSLNAIAKNIVQSDCRVNSHENNANINPNTNDISALSSIIEIKTDLDIESYKNIKEIGCDVCF